MSEWTLDDIYQCSVEEYAEALDTTVDDLIDQKWKEIDLLQRAYDKVVEKRSDMSYALLAKEINGRIHSKRKKIERFSRWVNESHRRPR